MWKREVDAEKLKEAFRPFWENDIDLSVLENFSPVFDGAPSLDENGVLAIKGHYPTQPSQVLFELKYILEGVNWKLVGTNINVAATE